MAVRGSTPVIPLIARENLTGYTVYVTFKDRFDNLITKVNPHLYVGEDWTVIAVALTQEETLALTQGRVDVELKAIDAEGVVLPYEIRSVKLTQTLLQEVIEYLGGAEYETVDSKLDV